MERIDAWRTNSGEVFTDKREAIKSIDEQMGAIITKHAHALAHIEKYTEIASYLINNLDSLALASALQVELSQA